MPITTSCQNVLKGSEMDLRDKVPEQYWDLIDQYRPELMQQAYSVLGNWDDAEDVVQETFCEAFRDTSKISEESIGASLRLINKTNALDRIRSRSRLKKRNEAKQDLVTKAFTTGGFSGIELRESITNALNTLPENLREVVVLRYFEHLSYKEIAERLQIPIGAVGPLLSEAGLRLYPAIANVNSPAQPRRKPTKN